MTPAEIRQLREDLGWSQAKLGQTLGVTATAVMKWEKGMSPPSDVIINLLKKLQAQLDRRKHEKKQEFIAKLGTAAVVGGIWLFLETLYGGGKNDD